mgnify:CR=1 FL=1
MLTKISKWKQLVLKSKIILLLICDLLILAVFQKVWMIFEKLTLKNLYIVKME